MGVKQVKVDVNEVTIGMFVSGLDRPWTQTPFPLQGFYVREAEEIRQLKAHCRHVYIDVAKGAGPVAARLKTISKEPQRKGVRATRSSKVKIDVSPLKIRRDVYKNQTPLKKEVKHARELHKTVFKSIGEVMQQLGSGEGVPVQETKRVASEMVDSVLRNPDAFTWLSRVKEADEHTYSHSVRSAVWAIIFGRHVGMAKKDLDTLAMGVLLKDVGKANIDRALLNKSQRTPAEESEYERFVEIGVEILRQTPNVEPKVISVVKTHCERVNGSGFPQQLRGDKIPLLGKIAGIVTFYDDVTNPRGEMYPLAPSRAVAKLYDRRDKEFQEELVVEFIRAIGLYPTGTLVELNTGEVAVVVEQNFERRLKPKVIIVLDACKEPLSKHITLDLAEDDRRKQALVDSGKKRFDEVEKIEIAQDLEPGSFDVDIQKIRDDYLFASVEKKGLFSFLKRR
ncbi:HD-GYP domain-containing protein [Pseudomaricurvus sp.]|uniref:HD-GYP domain-containing protein n=1 Tax=Pseudomaricurvus sp. TaxID=2004510 RepID=UPI003F6B9FF6